MLVCFYFSVLVYYCVSFWSFAVLVCYYWKGCLIKGSVCHSALKVQCDTIQVPDLDMNITKICLNAFLSACFVTDPCFSSLNYRIPRRFHLSLIDASRCSQRCFLDPEYELEHIVSVIVTCTKVGRAAWQRQGWLHCWVHSQHHRHIVKVYKIFPQTNIFMKCYQTSLCAQTLQGLGGVITGCRGEL